MIKEITEITIKELLDESAFETIEKIKGDIEYLVQRQDSLDAINIGTSLVAAILAKGFAGGDLRNLSKEDWKDIYQTVFNDIQNAEENGYSPIIFRTYARYIAESAGILRLMASDEICQSILGLSEELEAKTILLEEDGIDEVSYINDCLWISMEAMFRLLAARMTSFSGPDFQKLAHAATVYAVQYGRLTMLNEEKAILTRYLKNQYELDLELENKFNAYLEQLSARSVYLDDMISKSFEGDSSSRLSSSIELARQLGVPEEELLLTEEDIDDFFLN